jgi:hypothetical protein
VSGKVTHCWVARCPHMRLATSRSVAMLPTGWLCPNMRLAVNQAVAMNTSH